MPQREAHPAQAASFLTQSQTFARTPFNKPVGEAARNAPSAPAQQQGGSILSGLFGGKTVAQPEAAPSKDLGTLFARLSHGSAAPGRWLRDSLSARRKRDGDA
jgi:hypothetical protein